MILKIDSDEMLLVIMGLVRKINPAMLKAEADGFSVDFSPLEGKKELSSDEVLLIKLRTVAGSEDLSLDIDATEARQLGIALERLEKLQSWPVDVLNMSRTLRSKLATVV